MEPEHSDLAKLEEENRRLRHMLATSEDRTAHYAALFQKEAHNNEALTEMVRTAQAQMRIMRRSKVWQAGAVFRLARRSAGTVARNVGRLLHS